MAASQKIQPVSKEELKQLSHEEIVAFAARAALRVLPVLGREGNFNFWETEAHKHLLVVERAIFAPILFSINKINAETAFATAFPAGAAGDVSTRDVPAVYAAVYAARTTAAEANYDTAQVANDVATFANDSVPAPARENLYLANRMDYEFLNDMSTRKGGLNLDHFYQQPIWPEGTRPENWDEIEKNFLKALESVNYTELFERYQSGGAAYIDLPLEMPGESYDSPTGSGFAIAQDEERNEKEEKREKQKAPPKRKSSLSKQSSKIEEEQDIDNVEEAGAVGPQHNLTAAFPILAHRVDPAFGVQSQASIIAGLLENFEDEKGQFVGIFGQWGRGKTYFWEQVRNHLQKSEKKLYQTVTFHAWKYQDTPASWAYLYEILADAFLDKPKNYIYFKWIAYWIKIARLSIKRGQWRRPFWALLFSLGVTIFTLNTSILDSLTGYPFLVWLSIPAILGSDQLRKKYSTKAIDLFEKFGKKVSFDGYLGSQAEIQKELIILLKTWFPNSDKKKLLLFVDDVDRCDEERIIQIVDALRVMLEDEELVKRLIVVAAVDERILIRAIRKKYYDLIYKGNIETEEEKQEQLISMTREYMDKLFITGIKLPLLSSQELIHYLNNLTKKMKIRSDEQEKVSLDSVEEIAEDEEPDQILSPEPLVDQTEVKPKVLEKGIMFDPEIPLPEYDLSKEEITVLKETIESIPKSATPRQVRIFTYRYMMAIRLFRATNQYGNLNIEPGISNLDENHLLAMMILEYGLIKSVHELLEYKNKLVKRRGNNITIKTMNNSFIRSKEYLPQLFEVLEMVIAY